LLLGEPDLLIGDLILTGKVVTVQVQTPTVTRRRVTRKFKMPTYEESRNSAPREQCYRGVVESSATFASGQAGLSHR